MSGQAIPAHIKNAPILADIWTNVHQKGMNQNILFQGLPRTGKTSASIYFAEQLGVNYKCEKVFNPNKHIANDLVGLAEKIEKYDSPGQVLIWEEGGVSGKGAAARDWQRDENKLMGNIFQIMGLKNQILLINLPVDFLLEKQIRSLIHAQVQTNYFDHRNKMIVAKYRWCKYDYHRHEMQSRIPRYKVDGRIYEYSDYISIPAPSDVVWKMYREMEKNYKHDWIAQFLELMRNAKDKREKKKWTIKEIVKELSPYLDNFWDEKQNRVVAAHLRAEAERNGIMIGEHLVRSVSYEFTKLVKLGQLQPKRLVLLGGQQ
jgi:DNA polymerase III delta prime subunit